MPPPDGPLPPTLGVKKMRATSSLLPLLLLGACATADLKVPGELRGCWSNSEVETYRQDGTKSTVQGECTRFYDEERVLVTCLGPNANQMTTATFAVKLQSPSSYVQELVTSSHPAYAATYDKPHEFTLSGGSLTVVSYPVLTSTVPGRTVSKMVGRFSRIEAVDSTQCRPRIPR